MSSRILVIDNYDSFVFNLVDYLAQLGAEPVVARNDEVTVAEVAAFDGVLLSPGPGEPRDAGICLEVVRQQPGGIPIFGVCLGHQAIGEAFGGQVIRAPELLHGKTSSVSHAGAGVFDNLPSPFTATRYHSLVVERTSLPADLEITAETSNGLIMGLRHRERDIEGVQFHPESVLTEYGHLLIANWLLRCGMPSAVANAAGLSPLVAN